MNAERRRARQQRVAVAGMTLARRLATLDTRQAVDEVRIGLIAAIAETRAMWRFMIERGLATDAEREDYLDKGYQEVLDQIEGKAGEIFVEGQVGRG